MYESLRRTRVSGSLLRAAARCNREIAGEALSIQHSALSQSKRLPRGYADFPPRGGIFACGEVPTFAFLRVLLLLKQRCGRRDFSKCGSGQSFETTRASDFSLLACVDKPSCSFSRHILSFSILSRYGAPGPFNRVRFAYLPRFGAHHRPR